MGEAMRSLEDNGKNGWAMADFSVMMQDHARPHTVRVAMNYFKSCQTLPWSARSPDLCPIEHVFDLMGRRLHLPENADDLAYNWRKFGKKYRRIPSWRFITLYHVVWQLASSLEESQHFIELVTM
ncbi:uncharacterized protein TNCV_2442241 [Trichonephila clavipes]|nr:uncharacterized protein TNCV_2442241 [Trichonephila clavipes]